MKQNGKTNLEELNEFVGAIGLLQGSIDIIKEADTLLLKYIKKEINEELKKRSDRLEKTSSNTDYKNKESEE